MSSLTVCGLRGLRLFPLRSNRARRALLFLLRASWWWVNAFLCRVGRGFAPLDLPVLIPRVKKRPSPRDPRGVVRETTPSNANKRRCRAGRVRLRPLPTFSGRFRCSGRVTAAKPPKEKRGGFGANKFARNPAPRVAAPSGDRYAVGGSALFLPAQSAISRPYFRFELRARADSPRFAAVCAAACADL